MYAMITQAMIDRFYTEVAESIVRGEDELTLGYYANQEELLYDLLTGRREIWIEVVPDFRSSERLTFKVDMLEALRAVTLTYREPCAMAVRTGMTLDEAEQADQALEGRHPDEVKLADCHALWIGDFDKYGTECGLVMDLLVPRRERTAEEAASDQAETTRRAQANLVEIAAFLGYTGPVDTQEAAVAFKAWLDEKGADGWYAISETHYNHVYQAWRAIEYLYPDAYYADATGLGPMTLEEFHEYLFGVPMQDDEA